eukprot:1553925-Amphidinium_carterae.1
MRGVSKFLIHANGFQRSAARGWHSIDERSHDLPHLRQQLRGSAPSERPPRDAGRERFQYLQK